MQAYKKSMQNWNKKKKKINLTTKGLCATEVFPQGSILNGKVLITGYFQNLIFKSTVFIMKLLHLNEEDALL